MNSMNVAFCINDNYVDKVAIVMTSLLENHKKVFFNFFIFSSDVSESSLRKLNKLHVRYKEYKLTLIPVEASLFSQLKLNIDHISLETYYRYLIADLLPNIDKILYLDADLVVNGDITSFYETDLGDNYLAGASDFYITSIPLLQKLGLTTYINAGVLLMNLKAFRDDGLGQKLIDATIQLWDTIEYQDQDVLNVVCAGKILLVDSIYNFASSNAQNEKHRYKYVKIIHYTGPRKPWSPMKKSKQRKMLRPIWKRYNQLTQKILSQKIKVALLIDEFFGGAGTTFGGYGFLARKYIAKYIPSEDIHIDVLLGRGKKKLFAEKFREDNVDLYKLPKRHFASWLWLKKQKYDVYLSIQLQTDWVLRHETNPNKKLILWIQDPRPKSAWDNIINSMQTIKDPTFFTPSIYQTVHNWAKNGRITFISQGYSLNPLAIELYNLPQETKIQYLPNPIALDMDFQFDITKKKKKIIFLGRLEAQKRCWMFCEIAKRMPEYEFYVLGNFFQYQEDNKRMLTPYMTGDIPNLHFLGHVDGEKKNEIIKEARLLLSTAIWEGIPISWLEVLSYGTILVSDLEREKLVERFGAFVGEILGDGYNQVDKFIPAIKMLMENDTMYTEKALSAIQYIRETHNINRFRNDLVNVIYENV